MHEKLKEATGWLSIKRRPGIPGEDTVIVNDTLAIMVKRTHNKAQIQLLFKDLGEKYSKVDRLEKWRPGE